MAAPILPVGTGIGPVRSNPINVGGLGSAEAAFRQDAASGGMLGKLLGMYPTQTEAINARKSAQEGILQAIKNLTSGSGSINPNLVGAAMDGTGISGMPDPYTADQTMASGDAINSIDIFNPDLSAGGIGSERMPLTGGGDQPGDATFGGTIPGPRDPNLDVDIGAAGTGVEPPVKANNFDGDVLIETKPTIDDGGENDATPKQTPPTDPFEAALVEAMKDYEDTKAGKDTGTKDVDYYKNEFAKATGIDTSGQVDKSQALMAFGLALMQNKAGKGFDVGNMLSAVGAAGEKAQPLLAKAKSEARAAQLASGKYALNQISKDKTAEAAKLATKQKYIQELRKERMSALSSSLLAQQEHVYDMQKVRLENEGKIAAANAKGNVDIAKLQNEFTGEKMFNPVEAKKNITMHVANRKSTGGEVFTKPLTDVPLIAKGYADSLDGTASIDKMVNLITEASQASTTGGLAGQQLFEFVQKRAAAFGLNLNEDESGKNVGPVAEADAIKQRIIAQYKRFLTQETGNGISNTDIDRLAASLGQVNFFTNPQEAILRLQETRKIFESSTQAFQMALTESGDKDRYFNDDIYEKTQAKLQEAAMGSIGLGKESANIFTDPDTGIKTISYKIS
jgi:hypothetical protein